MSEAQETMESIRMLKALGFSDSEIDEACTIPDCYCEGTAHE